MKKVTTGVGCSVTIRECGKENKTCLMAHYYYEPTLKLRGYGKKPGAIGFPHVDGGELYLEDNNLDSHATSVTSGAVLRLKEGQELLISQYGGAKYKCIFR